MSLAELAQDENWQDENWQRQDAEQELRNTKREQERAMRDDTYAVLRAGYFDEAEAILLQRLEETGSNRFDCAREARVTTTPRMVGCWVDEVIDAAARDPRGGPLTAIEISLSNSGVRHTLGPANPGIEIGGYTDQFFPFSRASDGEIIEAQRGFAAPWQGSFDWFPAGAHHGIDGLGDINRALLTYRHSQRADLVWIGDRLEITPDAKAEPIAGLLLAIKFHRFIRDALAIVTLKRPYIVLAQGTDDVNIRPVHHRPRCEH